MTVPYHSHNFEIPTASRQDILDGTAADKVAVPASLGTAAAADSKDFATAAQGEKADKAARQAQAAADKAAAAERQALAAGDVHQTDLGGLAFKSRVTLADIAASGALNSGTVLYGDGVWRQPPAGNAGGSGGAGGGDMRQMLYDPGRKQADIYDMDNMAEGRVHKILSAADKEKLAALPADAVSAKQAVSVATEVQAGAGLAGGGALARTIQLKLSDAALAALDRGKSALQKGDVAALAFKNKIAAADIEAGGRRGDTEFLRGDGVWAAPKFDPSAPKPALPAGMLAPFAGLSAPEGWLICNGAAVSRQKYAALYAVIGSLYGADDSGGSFNLPDLRGEFIRGYDAGRGLDKDRVFGSAQADAAQIIKGGVSTKGVPNIDLFTAAAGAFAMGDFAVKQRPMNRMAVVEGASTDVYFDSSRVARTAEETRPHNVAMLYCIKF